MKYFGIFKLYQWTISYLDIFSMSVNDSKLVKYLPMWITTKTSRNYTKKYGIYRIRFNYTLEKSTLHKNNIKNNK